MENFEGWKSEILSALALFEKLYLYLSTTDFNWRLILSSCHFDSFPSNWSHVVPSPTTIGTRYFAYAIPRQGIPSSRALFTHSAELLPGKSDTSSQSPRSRSTLSRSRNASTNSSKQTAYGSASWIAFQCGAHKYFTCKLSIASC